jgi:NitT/TauT family transport system substrate-binding protein
MPPLTPLSKGVITLGILSVAGAAAWHLGVQDLVSRMGEGASDAPDAPSQTFAFGEETPCALGACATNPLKLSIVTFQGYAHLILANGGLKTQPGSIFSDLGIHVEFLVDDSIPTLTTLFNGNVAQCSWRTSDFFAQEHPSLRSNKLDAKAILIADNTQGADGIITRNSAINSVEDLPGHTIGLLQFTPSDGMTLDAIRSSSLTGRKKASIDFVYVDPDEGTAGVRAMFEAGKVESAVLWDPDLSLALLRTKGSKVIYSTATATNLIYDVFVCDTRYLDDPANTDMFQKFVDGSMAGADLAYSDIPRTMRTLVAAESGFDSLAKELGEAEAIGFLGSLIKTPSNPKGGLVWAGAEHHARILGRAGGTNQYERVYQDFDNLYREAGYTSPANAPVINARDSFDYRFIDNYLERHAVAAKEAAKPEHTFTAKKREEVSTQTPSLTKPVSVSFKTGSADLTKRAMLVIDNEMAPLIENNGAAYFLISGNTDSTGSLAVNMRLSQARGQAVANYLITEWEFPAERFNVVGNGPNKPLCNEKEWAAEGYESLAACQEDNRTTRAAILGN